MDSLVNFNVAVRVKKTNNLTIEQIRGAVTDYVVALFEGGAKILLCGIDSVEVIRDDEELIELVKDVDDCARSDWDRTIDINKDGNPGDINIYSDEYDSIEQARAEEDAGGIAGCGTANLDLVGEFQGQKMVKITFPSGHEVLINAVPKLVSDVLCNY